MRILFWMLVCCAGLAQAVDRIGVLDNGLKYAIRHTDQPAGEVEFRLVVNAGEIDVADAGLEGGMHLIEHMAFRDTDAYPSGTLVPYLRTQGFRFGEHLNGWTSPSATQYQLAFPHGDAAGVGVGLRVLAGIAAGIRFDPATLDAERKIVAEELRSRQNNPWLRFWVQERALYQQGTGVESWSYGTPDSVAAMPADALRALYRRLYTPGRMAVVVAGDIDPGRVESQLRTQFAGLWPKIDGKQEQLRAPMPASTSLAYTVTLVDDGMNDWANLGLSFPRPDFSSAEGVRLSYTASLLKYALKQRLAQRGVDYQIDWRWRDDGQPILNFGYRLMPEFGKHYDRLDSRQQLLNLEGQLAAFVAQPLDDRTLAQLKREYIGTVVQWHANDRGRAKAEADLLALAALGQHPWSDSRTEMPELRKAVDSVDAKALSAMLADALARPRYLQFAYQSKYIKQLPDRDTVLGWYKDFKPGPQPAAFGDYAALAFPGPKAEPGKIVSVQRSGEIEALTLSNGVKVLLRPMLRGDGLVYFRFGAMGGQFQFGESQYAAALVAPSAIAGMTVALLPQSEIARIRLADGVSLATSVEQEWFGFYGSGLQSGLPTVLAELHHRFNRDPRKDRLGGWGRDELIKQDTPLNSMAKLLYQDMRNAAFPDDYRLQFANPRWYDDYQNGSLEQVVRQLYADPSRFTFGLVGDFDPDAIKPLLEKWLANLPRRDDVVPTTIAQVKAAAGGDVQETDTTRRNSYVRVEFNTRQSWSPAVIAQGWLLKTVLEERLRLKLRDEGGISYLPTVAYQLLPGSAQFAQLVVGFDVDPRQEGKAMDDVRSVFASLRETPVGTRDLETARRIVLREARAELDLPAMLCWRMLTNDAAGLPMSDVDAVYKAVDTVDAAALQDGARRWLSESGMTIGRLSPNPQI
ncbi:M16 family metallopeptidase [Jeongeupia naejangsanensis]|uniref:Insulinase family protein n=1 Tax=Jeongeupia naejangsanensis TaxID=613195 RepID=A0ABS2BFH3_9NEIS|nr:M16 family metallopeptidase [Jeongeupia naejangsanensis]MBM3114200.1 insulinase family protein [Jeongeupia naejangsanensis]